MRLNRIRVGEGCGVGLAQLHHAPVIARQITAILVMNSTQACRYRQRQVATSARILSAMLSPRRASSRRFSRMYVTILTRVTMNDE
eukprot:SAG22_NODE_8175_length_677_cov_1.200692_2_plen_86_part_00